MKPVCYPCTEFLDENTLSTLFGKDYTENLVYELYNPNDKKIENSKISELSQKYEQEFNNDPQHNNLDLLNDSKDDWLYQNTIQKTIKKNYIQKKIWHQIQKGIKSGNISPDEISVNDLINNLSDIILDELVKEGYIDIKLKDNPLYLKDNISYLEYTNKSEEIIAQKILDETIQKLDKSNPGNHEIVKSGISNFTSNTLIEYDYYLHDYDMLDIQETLLSSILRNNNNLEIKIEDLKIREQKSLVNSNYVILLDSSYSMHGNKFLGGQMATLSLQKLIKNNYKDDYLDVVTYSDNSFLVDSGELLKIKPHGNTDIGQAIDFAIKLLNKKNGNKNIILITDSEPTTTSNNQLPEDNMYRAAYLSGKENIRLNIIMLDKSQNLRIICEQMANLNGNSTVVYVENPLNLKEFLIHSFIKYKK